MSYVHDMHLDLDYDPAAFAAAVADIRTLFRRSELPVVGPTGRPATTPVLEDDYIGFNGINRDCTCDPHAPWYHSRDEYCMFVDCGAFDPGPNNDGGEPFVMDLTRGPLRGAPRSRGRHWFDCKTRLKPYDQAVMLAMIPLKRHLGEQIDLYTKGSWPMWEVGDSLIAVGRSGWSSSSVVALYEHVLPERAPVKNILSHEADGWPLRALGLQRDSTTGGTHGCDHFERGDRCDRQNYLGDP